MSASKVKYVTSDTYTLIQQLSMSSRRREVARSALHKVEVIADCVAWAVGVIKHLR